MLCQWTMASFATDLSVHASLLHFLDVGVASLASLVAGEVDRMGGNLCDGSSAVMSILSETMRDKKSAYAQKRQCADCIERDQSKKMS